MAYCTAAISNSGTQPSTIEARFAPKEKNLAPSGKTSIIDPLPFGDGF